MKTASITELRQNATSLIKFVEETHEPLFVLQRSKKAAVLLDGESFEKLISAAQDQKDYEFAQAALHAQGEKLYSWDDVETLRSKK